MNKKKGCKSGKNKKRGRWKPTMWQWNKKKSNNERNQEKEKEGYKHNGWKKKMKQRKKRKQRLWSALDISLNISDLCKEPMLELR